jgi:ankyrin repeat protein
MSLGLVQGSLAQKKDPPVTVNKRDDIVLDFEGDTKKDSLLLRASYLGDVTQIGTLLKAGANVDAKEHLYHWQAGDTPLCFAARGNHLEAVRILLAHGAAVNGCYALTIGLKNPELVRLLLAHGADPNETAAKPSPSDGLRSTLLYAASSWHDDPVSYTETIRLLLKAGADPKAISMYGQNALFLLGTASPFTYGPVNPHFPQIEDSRYFEVVGLLVKNGVEINRVLAFYYDKLCCADVAVRKGSPYCYQVTDKGCMVQEERELCKADRIELESTPGVTPLAMAAYISNVGLVRALLHFGADPALLNSNRNLVIKDHEIQQLLAGKLSPTPRPRSASAQSSERPSTSPQQSVPAIHKTAIDDQFTKYICYTGPGHRPGYKENAEIGFGADKYLDVRIDDPSGLLSGEAISEIGRELSRGLVVWRRMCLQCATANAALLSINGRF